MDTQAGKIFARFGGARRLYEALARTADLYGEEHRRDASALYRWNHPKSEGGTGGLIPTGALASIQLAARLEGIIIPPADFMPTRALLE